MPPTATFVALMVQGKKIRLRSDAKEGFGSAPGRFQRPFRSDPRNFAPSEKLS